MILEFVKQWEERKHLLEEWLTNNMPSSYDDIYKKLFSLVITEPLEKYSFKEWDWDRYQCIDNGDYQGTQIFILCDSSYQPSLTDYIFTEVDYGSCSGCDTFYSICEIQFTEELPNKEQVKQFMQLALHMVQQTKTFNTNER